MIKITDRSMWNGRTDSINDPSMFRMHQIIQVVDLDKFSEVQTKPSFGFIGFESDEGIARNKGRVGASKGPDSVRSSFASLPSLSQQYRFFDFGNVFYKERDLEGGQKELGFAIDKLLSLNIFPIIIGGGHDVAYGHYLGIASSISESQSLGILNIDAHFDMRPYEDGPSSGTMFKQMLDNNRNNNYFCIGIQQTGNTTDLFETANSYGCQYILEENINGGSLNNVLEQVRKFIRNHDYVLLTLCSDVMAASAAPGVSAPSPFGLDPKIVRRILRQAIAFNNILGFDVAEISPPLDENGKTAKLGAQMLFELMSEKAF